MHGDNKIWTYLLHLLNGLSNNWFKNRTSEMKATQNGMNLLNSRNLLRMFDDIE